MLLVRASNLLDSTGEADQRAWTRSHNLRERRRIAIMTKEDIGKALVCGMAALYDSKQSMKDMRSAMGKENFTCYCRSLKTIGLITDFSFRHFSEGRWAPEEWDKMRAIHGQDWLPES